jgi:hypothetical protein
MFSGHSRTRMKAFALLAGLATLLATASCANNEGKAKKAVEEYLKNQGATKIVIDLFYTNKNDPDKAYTSATITYNFASSSGNPQREFLGFILARDGNTWRIEKNASYTKEEDQAARYLAGGK